MNKTLEESRKEFEESLNEAGLTNVFYTSNNTRETELPPNYETKYLALLEDYKKLSDKYADLAVKAYNGNKLREWDHQGDPRETEG